MTRIRPGADTGVELYERERNVEMALVNVGTSSVDSSADIVYGIVS